MHCSQEHNGPFVYRIEDTCLSRRKCGFDSHLGYCHDPVVQRRRLLAHIQATMVRVHPGSLKGCSSNGKTPASQVGNRGSSPRRSITGSWSKGMTPAWHAGNPGSTPG